ncbi:MAG TPA: hypothetical protein VHZ26_02655 [Caulobacteraceae bacterium]|jgi:hypothetical protein|nr:hypothetical protein [Caulobacteraceae bacterium]
MIFGKRAAPAAIPQHPGPDADGVRRVIPNAVFEGAGGAFLKELGFGPDDPDNLIVTQELADARFDVRREGLERIRKAINSQLPRDCQVIPWAMIPWSLWKGPDATFLMSTLDFYPPDLWNTMLLPETDLGAVSLDLPKHPGVTPPGLEPAAAHLIGQIHEQVRTAHRRTTNALARLDMDAAATFVDVVNSAKAKMMYVAHKLSETTFGAPAMGRHQALFGKALGRPDLKP